MPLNWNEGIRTTSNLPNGVRDRRVAFEPLQRRGVQVEDRVAVAGDFRGVGLAVQHPDLPSVARGRLDREPAGDEREQIRRQRLRLREADAAAPARPEACAATSAPLATACQPAGTSSVSV